MKNSQPQVKDTIIQLLSNFGNANEINQYRKRFVDAGQNRFAVIKVGGAVLDDDLDNLCSSIAFLTKIGLFPIVVHGAGPQLTKNLQLANIKSDFINGQRATSAEALKIARKTFNQQNMKLANTLQSMGVKTASITSGVFFAKKHDNNQLGYVGEVNYIDLEFITTAINEEAIPILSPLAETDTGQSLNINADIATSQLAIAIQPYKIIFLTETGGLLDQNGSIVSSVNLATDYDDLMTKDWLHGGMKLKIKQAAGILNQLPVTASVSITKPAHLPKELFTHKGYGTLLSKGEAIQKHSSKSTIDAHKLRALLETGFHKSLDKDYFANVDINKAFITGCYRAAALVTEQHSVPFLDKFVVAEDAKGEGLGKAVWARLRQEYLKLFWRCKPDNLICNFYFKHCDGCYKTDEWTVFWSGIKDIQEISSCIDYALSKPVTLR